MATIDLAEDHTLGEDILKNAETQAVEIAPSQTIVAGDYLDISGINSDLQSIVSKNTGATNPKFIAMEDITTESDDTGKFIQVLFRGVTKAAIGAVLSAGASISVSTNKAIAATTLKAKGYIIQATTTTDELALIYFDGGMS